MPLNLLFPSDLTVVLSEFPPAIQLSDERVLKLVLLTS